MSCGWSRMSLSFTAVLLGTFSRDLLPPNSTTNSALPAETRKACAMGLSTEYVRLYNPDALDYESTFFGGENVATQMVVFFGAVFFGAWRRHFAGRRGRRADRRSA